MILLEEADTFAQPPVEKERALTLLTDASSLAPEYALWYAGQPQTFAGIASDTRFTSFREAAVARFETLAETAPSLEHVTMALAGAQHKGRARPAPQASRAAIVAQVLTLAGTLGLLIWWTSRFFLTVS